VLFSSLVFLFVFLPLVLPVALIRNTSVQNYFLLFASLIFYAWGGVSYTVIMLASIILNYFTGIGIDFLSSPKNKKLLLVTGVVLNLSLLVIFKYLNFLIASANSFLPFNYKLTQTHIALPIGISFFTFHGLSYIIDVYRGRIQSQKNLSIIALYIILFPQLIAGPIIRYKVIYHQFEQRYITIAKFAHGIKRFVIGLGKKVLIANAFAAIADKIFSADVSQLPASTAWLGIISYTIQIYFDFSGYSDMAVGLGRMFGFTIPENFNLPYISQSIKEFWRRWHISLSTWFRDYLYIPLGGNQLSEAKTYRNLVLVFFLCGLWHGASWTFLAWGIYHGLFLVLERGKIGALIGKMWKPLRHIYALLVVMIGWVFFRSETFAQAFNFIEVLFGAHAHQSELIPAWHYLSNETVFLLLMAIIFSTNLPKHGYIILKRNLVKMRFYSIRRSMAIQTIVLDFTLLFIFCVSVFSLAGSSYNPFIYFRF
jgi:alginate O-acetyltransferase complex protein AlgI